MTRKQCKRAWIVPACGCIVSSERYAYGYTTKCPKRLFQESALSSQEQGIVMHGIQDLSSPNKQNDQLQPQINQPQQEDNQISDVEEYSTDSEHSKQGDATEDDTDIDDNEQSDDDVYSYCPEDFNVRPPIPSPALFNLNLNNPPNKATYLLSKWSIGIPTRKMRDLLKLLHDEEFVAEIHGLPKSVRTLKKFISNLSSDQIGTVFMNDQISKRN